MASGFTTSVETSNFLDFLEAAEAVEDVDVFLSRFFEGLCSKRLKKSKEIVTF